MRDLLTEIMVNNDNFYQGNLEFFEDVEEEEKKERLQVYRDWNTWDLYNE